DDHVRVRRRHASFDRVERCGIGHEPGYRLRHLRRTVARAAPDAPRYTGCVFAVRRRRERATVQPAGGPGGAKQPATHDVGTSPRDRTVMKMKYTLHLGLVLALVPAAAVSGQPADVPMRLTVDGAVRLALENNLDLAADRLDPQIGDLRVSTANGAFRPNFNTNLQRNNQLQPPASFLIPTPTRNDVASSNVGIGQRLPWVGTSYNIGWNSSHTVSNSFLSSYNPLLQSGLSLNVTQPLFKDLSIDGPRSQLALQQGNRSMADTRLRESIVHTTAGTKTAYWNLVNAIANVDARRSALLLAEELVRVNKAKVD